MAADNIFGTVYCLLHGRYCTAMQSFSEGLYHIETVMETTISGEDYMGYEKCFGPFTFVAPPDPLTETEWSNIISNEQEAIQW